MTLQAHPYVAPATHAVFVLENVSKAFGPTVLLKNANLQVTRGQTLAIIGESGSGKSVLLKMLMGLVEPDEGRVLFKGQDVLEMDQESLNVMRRSVGYVFQNDALFDSMTIVDNIGYAMREHTKASDADIRARAMACLQMVGLENRILDLYPAALSGGMRKRVGIARAVALEPEVLLYDEPTQGLDPQSITRIANLIEQTQRGLSATSVVVTHDMRTAFTVSDQIALLHESRFDYVGTPAQFARTTDAPVQEFIADALEELRDIDFGEPGQPDPTSATVTQRIDPAPQ